MELTYLDSNSWLIEMAGKRILLDPWLVGSLMFGNTPWLFKGDRPQDRPIPENIDLILLSQGLPDHAHIPTLEQLDHALPVVASPNAAKVVESLGYQTIHTLEHHQKYTIDNLEILALKGSPVGPTTLENGYLLKDLSTGQTLYYEPHGYHSPELKQYAPIDVVVTPLINLTLPLLGPVIKGQASALQVCEWLKPQVILPTAAGGDINFEGLVMKFLKPQGTVADFKQMLHEKQPDTLVLEPTPGTPCTVLA
ncbi:MBL fold metallo-hydrolase [Synechococcus sp. BDU 130192]|uniref:MBL fold metallo-hydrolase n=1 Tax=Synechococcus sp. BDU 130192 TaxID=2042059 RepID=UPI000C07F6FC|nr:MBL fold metallo-hydrolase [Synechococcus sp. BDU 130192]